jgi:hypothetical protein
MTVIPNIVINGQVIIRSFAQKGATPLTSLSSILFRTVIPKSWPTTNWLPKSISLGGQLGRATSGIGFYITVGQSVWSGFQKFQTMPTNQQFNFVNYQMHSGGYVPEGLRSPQR